MTTDRTPHRVRHNRGSHVPARHVVLAAVTSTVEDRRSWLHVWREGHAVMLHRTDGGTWVRAETATPTPESLWDAVDAHTRRRSRTVVWSFDLAYHVRVAHALRELDRLQWTYVAGNDATHSGWQRWAKGDRTLMLVDVQSVWPVRVSTLRTALQRTRTDHLNTGGPDYAAPSAVASYARTLADAVLWYLRWLEDSNEGVWQPTGSGQAWASWRHRHMTYPPHVHSDEELLAVERRAMWTGRCEAWRWGRSETEPVYEWDMAAAYCRIASQIDVPARLIGEVDVHDGLGGRGSAVNRRVLSLCEVQTAVPTVPAERDGRILWPTGSFDSVLWDNEIVLARGSGAQITRLRSWEYLARPVLTVWGEHTLERLDASPADIHPLERLIHKHRSRALVGRLALRYRRWEHFGVAPESDWRRLDSVDAESGERSDMLWMGRTLQRAGGVDEGPDSLPMITGYIMAECRVRLWRCMLSAGLENVLYVDTDSVVVTGRGDARLRADVALGAVTGLRRKARHRGYDIRGPRQAWFGGMPRLSGIPLDAVRTGPDTARGAVTESLAAALAAGRVGSVRVTDRVWHLAGVDRRRVHLPGGGTTAVEVSTAGAQAVETV